MDDIYKPFIEDGEIIYSVKVDSILALPGRYRIKIRAGFASAPHVKKVRITWDNGESEQEWDVTGSNDSVFYDFMIDSLEERSYVFEVYSIDAKGNRSVKTDLFASVYGDKYNALIKNRSVQKVDLTVDSAMIEMNNPEKGMVGTIFNYTSKGGEQKSYFLPAEESMAIIKDCDYSVTLNYKSAYLPEPNAIDTFYTESNDLDLSHIPFKFDKTIWTVVDFSSEEPAESNWSPYPSGYVIAVIDDNIGTFWHTAWANSQPGYPHWFIIDMHANVNVQKFTCVRRQGDGRGHTKVQFFISMDGTNWTDLGEFPFDSGTDNPQDFVVNAGTSARYFKFVAVEGPNFFTNMAEISAYGTFASN